MSQTTTNQDVVDGRGAQGLNAEGWPQDTILLVLAYSKTEHYLPAIRQNLDAFWPGRPRTLYVTDGDVAGDDVVQAKGRSFVELLAEATSVVRERFPKAANVFVLLEDLCPLGPVDEAALSQAQELLRANGKAFLCHNWAQIQNGVNRYSRWDGPATLRDGDVTLWRMPEDCEFHNCLVAAFWTLDHLDDVIAIKRADGLHDPWSFERPLEETRADHYMFEGIWPVSKDGFSARGKINPNTVARRGFPDSPLMSQLRKEFCGVDNYHVAAVKRAWLRLGHSIGKQVGRLSNTRQAQW